METAKTLIRLDVTMRNYEEFCSLPYYFYIDNYYWSYCFNWKMFLVHIKVRENTLRILYIFGTVNSCILINNTIVLFVKNYLLIIESNILMC